MNKFKGYLILSDIDGTLTNDRGQISAENAAAIRYFQEEGFVKLSRGTVELIDRKGLENLTA